MRHIFRLNVYRKGYTLYSGDGLSQYQEFPLDIQSNGISRNYLSAQRRIDSILKTQVSRWCFCVANNNLGEFAVTAYGCFLVIEDEKGRTGISFIHAIESNDNLNIDQVVVLISQLLLQQTAGRLSELIAGVAKGTFITEEILNFLTEHFKKKHQHCLKHSLPLNKPIKEIKQDCGGASGATWLAMAISHLNSPAPWEIYEEYSHHTKLVSTVSSLNQATGEYLLSDYLSQIIRHPEFSKESVEISDINARSEGNYWQVILSLGSLIVAMISLIFLVGLKSEVVSLNSKVESLQEQNAGLTNTIEFLSLLLEISPK